MAERTTWKNHKSGYWNIDVVCNRWFVMGEWEESVCVCVCERRVLSVGGQMISIVAFSMKFKSS